LWIVRLALSRPYTFVVVALLIVLLGIVSILRMPKDIFPEIAEPVVTLIWQYQGIPPDAFEKQITIFSEQQINTTVSNIKRIESHTINSKNVIRIFFQPSVRIDQAVSQITATSQTIIRRMPPGQQPPQIVQYDASSVPILQIALGSDTLSEQQLYDQGLWLVRNEVVPVPGATVPLPYGGRPRLVMIDADPVRMHAKGITAKDINDALNRQNVNLPTGSTQIGSRDYVLSINNSPQKIAELGLLPIKSVGGAMVYVNDVADVRDGYNEQTSLVRHDGRKSALITVLKSGGASTLDIIREVRQRLANVTLPEGLSLSFLFDQSVFVANAMRAVVVEGLMAAGLTGLLILLFLGSWRSTVVVVTSIPLAIMFSVIMLSALGYSLNLMTLGGLALAVGILVDDATVTIENIHRHMAMGKGLRSAILDGSQQIVVPALVSMLCICVVFLPVMLLTGAAKYLFTPMALAVVFSILASYGISRTLVPVMSRYLLLENAHGGGSTGRLHAAVERNFERLRRGYVAGLRWSLTSRTTVFALFIVLVIGSIGAVLFIGWEFFPVVDAGQIRLHVNAPAGTRIEDTGTIFSHVEDEIRRVVEPKDLDVVIDNIGIPPSTNLAYSDNVTLSSGDGEILVSLKADHDISTKEYVRRLRQVLPDRFPECTFYFQPGDMMNQILNFGLPAPIDVKIIGGDYKNFQLAKQIEARMKRVAGAVDVHVHQIMNQPALRVEVDRTRASQLGVTQREIAENYLIASSSSVVITPNYWNDPQTGRPYQVVVVAPHETALNSIDAILNIPLPGKGQSPTQTLGNVATVKRVDLPAIINHVNTELAFDVYANVQGRDLGAVASDVRKVVEEFIPKAKEQKNNTRIEIYGQAESMYDAFTRMGIGLIAAVLLVYFIMVINFQSWTDPFIIITALPGAFCGIIWILFLTGTNFSVPSLMGAIMSVGVATANSILMVSFANELLREGKNPIEAALEAGATRLRPVLMTASAMVIGMAPMASGLGEGGEQNAPLGRAVIGGLVLATIATLFFVPVVFSILRRHGAHKPRFGDDGTVTLVTSSVRD
jgi:multidrug efflux pump subunit AcrB